MSSGPCGKKPPATAEDAALVAAAVERCGSQSEAARQVGVKQPRLSAASVAGQGRALSASMRERLQAIAKGVE